MFLYEIILFYFPTTCLLEDVLAKSWKNGYGYLQVP